jgi:hypothetical protein
MIVILAFLACRGDTQHDGTIVGNPGDAKTKIAQGSDLEFVYGFGSFLEIMIGTIDEVWEMEDLEGLDLIDPQQSIEIPAGSWDKMSIYVQEIYLQGINNFDDRSFTIILEDVMIELDGQQSFNISEEEYILELARPDWLTGEFLGEIAGSETGDTGLTVMIDIGSDEYDSLFNIVEEQTGLFNDLDGDGEVNTQEREEGNVAYTTSTAEEQAANNPPEEDTGEPASETVSTCGCSDTSMSLFLIPFLTIGILWRRED